MTRDEAVEGTIVIHSGRPGIFRIAWRSWVKVHIEQWNGREWHGRVIVFCDKLRLATSEERKAVGL